MSNQQQLEALISTICNEDVEVGNQRHQGDSLADLLVAALPAQTILALTDALVAQGDDVWLKSQGQ